MSLYLFELACESQERRFHNRFNNPPISVEGDTVVSAQRAFLDIIEEYPNLLVCPACGEELNVSTIKDGDKSTQVTTIRTN